MTGHISVDASPLAMAAAFLVGYLAGRLAKISDAPVDVAVAEVREVLSSLAEVWPEV